MLLLPTILEPIPSVWCDLWVLVFAILPTILEAIPSVCCDLWVLVVAMFANNLGADPIGIVRSVAANVCYVCQLFWSPSHRYGAICGSFCCFLPPALEQIPASICRSGCSLFAACRHLFWNRSFLISADLGAHFLLLFATCFGADPL